MSLASDAFLNKTVTVNSGKKKDLCVMPMRVALTKMGEALDESGIPGMRPLQPAPREAGVMAGASLQGTRASEQLGKIVAVMEGTFIAKEGSPLSALGASLDTSSGPKMAESFINLIAALGKKADDASAEKGKPAATAAILAESILAELRTGKGRMTLEGVMRETHKNATSQRTEPPEEIYRQNARNAAALALTR